MGRSRAYYRHVRRRAIARKTKIARQYMYAYCEDLLTVVFIGKLAKGKIHCSCRVCKTKYRNVPRWADYCNIVFMQEEVKRYTSN